MTRGPPALLLVSSRPLLAFVQLGGSAGVVRSFCPQSSLKSARGRLVCHVCSWEARTLCNVYLYFFCRSLPPPCPPPHLFPQNISAMD